MWLVLSLPLSSFLVALGKGTLSNHLKILSRLSIDLMVWMCQTSLYAGWAIHHSMSDSWAASMRVEYGKLSDLCVFIRTVSNSRSFDLRSDSSSM